MCGTQNIVRPVVPRSVVVLRLLEDILVVCGVVVWSD